MNEFSHIDKQGNVKMVDITDKVSTVRTAKAEGKVFLQPETISAIKGDALPKGNVLTIAKVAGGCSTSGGNGGPHEGGQ